MTILIGENSFALKSKKKIKLMCKMQDQAENQLANNR